MVNREAFTEFIMYKKLADLSPKTIIDYNQFINPFIDFLGSNNEITDIKQEDINTYITTLIDKPISKATRSTYIRHIKMYLKWLHDYHGKDIRFDYKRVKVPKNPKKNVLIYSDVQLNDIFSHIHAESDWITNRNKCIVALMYDSGLRQSEVCSIKRSYVSYSENRIVVKGKGNKERTVPLGKLTAHYMKLYQDECPYKSDKLFVNRRGKDLSCNAVKLLISRISDSLDFEFSSHKLRHNFATNYCIDQYYTCGNIDIYRLMIILGHEDIETTRRYLHHANEIIGVNSCISHLDKVLGGKN